MLRLASAPFACWIATQAFTWECPDMKIYGYDKGFNRGYKVPLKGKKGMNRGS